ncbi:MAG: hypothetical protein DA328_09465 [Nitrososphaeraceae archaeon]|nr:hypothetical protein [Nitrososphaeraceae archaeon]
MNELKEVRRVFQGLQTLYKTYFSKVDPALLNDLLTREQEKREEPTLYLVQMWTNDSSKKDFIKTYIVEKTGMMPSIHDNGRHFVTNHILNLELLKDFSDLENVTRIKGYFTGAIYGVGA